MRMFSLDVARALRAIQSDDDVATAIERIARWFAVYDTRGLARSVRARYTDEMDAWIYGLGGGLQWQTYNPADPPTSQSIAGFSRVGIEAVLMQNAALRTLEYLVGPEGAELLYHRRIGSDLCECLNSMARKRHGDRVPEKRWRQFMLKLSREASKRFQDASERAYPMFTEHHGVYAQHGG